MIIIQMMMMMSCEYQEKGGLAALRGMKTRSVPLALRNRVFRDRGNFEKGSGALPVMFRVVS
jgi:hypothetical protein